MIRFLLLLMLGFALFTITKLTIRIYKVYQQKHKYPKYYRVSLLKILKANIDEKIHLKETEETKNNKLIENK